MKSEIVKQHNNSIQYSFSNNLTGNQKSIQSYCLAMLEKKLKTLSVIKENDLEYVEISLSDFNKKMNYKDLYDYRQVKEDLERIVGNPIKFTKKVNGKEKFYISSVIQSAKGDEATGKIKIKFDKYIIKNYIGILEKNQITNYSIDTFLNLQNNIYAQLMYEYCKSFEGLAIKRKDNIYELKLSINWLQNYLLEKDKKGEFVKNSLVINKANFNIRVIDVFTNIINDYSDIKFLELGSKFNKDGQKIPVFYKIEKNNYIFKIDYSNSDRKESIRIINNLKKDFSIEKEKKQYKKQSIKKINNNKFDYDADLDKKAKDGNPFG